MITKTARQLEVSALRRDLKRLQAAEDEGDHQAYVRTRKRMTDTLIEIMGVDTALASKIIDLMEDVILA